MAEKEVHPGSFVGDSIEEFKKLPTWGKIAVGVVLVVIAYLAIKAKNAANITGSAQPMTGTETTSGTQSPFPTVGGLPLLPPGVNPIYNPTTGETVGYQQQPPAAPPSGPPSGPRPSPQPIIPPSQANQGSSNPLIPYGQYKGPSYSNLKPGTTYTYQGVTYMLHPGAGGRLWGTVVNGGNVAPGTGVLLYGPQSSYSSPSYTPPGATPHISSAIPGGH